jgi:hypothetical protein
MTTETETTAAPTVNVFAKPFAKVAKELGAAEAKVRGLMRITIGYAGLSGKRREVETILDATDVAVSTKRTIKATADRIREFFTDGYAEPLGGEHAGDREKVREWVNAIMAKVGASNDAEFAGKLRDYKPPVDPSMVEPPAEVDLGQPLDAQPSPQGRTAILEKANVQPTVSAAAPAPTLAEQMTAYALAMSPDTRREWLVGLFAKLAPDEVDTLITTLSAAPIQTDLAKAA